MIRFKSLLKSKGIAVTSPIVMQLIKHYASAVPLVSNADEAADLYYTASRIPRSATQLVLLGKGVSVAEPYQASDPSKAVLMQAFRDGIPMILKIGSPDSLRKEMGVMERIRHGANENNLVVIEELEFQSATIEITGTDGSLFVPYSRARSGMLMQHYQTTLAQCRIPLTEDVILKYGHRIKRAILHMHANGYCHLDIKPSNIFLLGDSCHLGDYGAATLVGDGITECTRNYYPSDFPPTADKKTDFLLLAKTVLELYGKIESPVQPMSTEEILRAVRGMEADSVRELLLSCFDE